AGLLALGDHFRAGLDRPVHRAPCRRQEAVVLQGPAVPADRAGVVAGLCVPQVGLAILMAWPVRLERVAKLYLQGKFVVCYGADRVYYCPLLVRLHYLSYLRTPPSR